MVLHNDIWGNTSVTVIEEIDSRFLIAEELNMLALYSRLNKEQSNTLQEALATFYDILLIATAKIKLMKPSPLLRMSHSMMMAMNIFAWLDLCRITVLLGLKVLPKK